MEEKLKESQESNSQTEKDHDAGADQDTVKVLIEGEIKSFKDAMTRREGST